jgi:hypothetical protein
MVVTCGSVMLSLEKDAKSANIKTVGWRRVGLGLLCRRTFKALNLDLASRCHSLLDSTRRGSALFHDIGLE